MVCVACLPTYVIYLNMAFSPRLVVLHNSVWSISNHCLLDQLPRASLHVSSLTPHLQSCFKLVQSSFSDAAWTDVFMLQSTDRGNTSQMDELTQK